MRPVPAIPPPAGALSPARPRRRRPPAVACDANASRPVSAVAWRAYRRAELLLARQAWPAGSRRLLAAARRRLAAEMGVSPGEVEVCSGGTEANAWALDVAMATIRAAWRGDGAPQVLVSALEHPAVADGVRRLASLYAFDVGVVLPAPDGRVPAAAFAAALTPATALCCLMMAHNETGAVQPVAAAVAACRALCSLRGQAPPRWHSDAVQAASSLPLRPAEMGVDSLAFAGHKLGAVGGVGCLVLRGPRLPPPAWRGGIGPRFAPRLRRRRLPHLGRSRRSRRRAVGLCCLGNGGGSVQHWPAAIGLRRPGGQPRRPRGRSSRPPAAASGGGRDVSASAPYQLHSSAGLPSRRPHDGPRPGWFLHQHRQRLRLRRNRSLRLAAGDGFFPCRCIRGAAHLLKCPFDPGRPLPSGRAAGGVRVASVGLSRLICSASRPSIGASAGRRHRGDACSNGELETWTTSRRVRAG